MTWVLVWYTSLFLLLTGQVADGKRGSTDLTKECMEIKGRGLHICNSVSVEDKLAQSDPDCNLVNCKASCCDSVKKCKSSTILSYKLFDCISSRMTQKNGSCCIVTDNTSDVVVPYISGALGLLLTCAGLYFLVTMGSKKGLIRGEEPVFNYEEDESKVYDVNKPYLKVPKVLATDEDDVFWKDD